MTATIKGGSEVICGFTPQALTITPIQVIILFAALLSITYALVLQLRKPIRD